MKNILIPPQTAGKHVEVRSETVLENSAQAQDFYELVQTKLFDINNWEKVCGTAVTNFQLTFADGSPAAQLAEGNLIKINILGPGPVSGDGYDWVRIEMIAQSGEEELNSWTGFRVRPCTNPNHPDLGIAHFFDELATSTFMVGRTNETVWAAMYGRNEMPNQHSAKLIDNLRNGVVGLTAKMGLSYPQWNLLCEGLVKEDT